MRNKIYSCIAVLCVILIVSVSVYEHKLTNINKSTSNPAANPVFSSSTSVYNMTMKRDILCLMIGYWDHIKGPIRTSDGNVYLVMNSGKRILYDDKKYKTDDQKFANADLQDMMEQIYPLYDIKYLLPKDFNPGQYRVQDFFKEIYGTTKQKTEASLVSVGWGYRTLSFNQNADAAYYLSHVDRELMALTATRTDITPYVYPSDGTYNYRTIAGYTLLSEHAFGIAIDMPANGNDYYSWTSRTLGQNRLDTYPREVVKIFEKYNFIWGGKWYYFDFMHYEYRPELIIKAKYFPNSPDPSKPWYTGAPYDTNVHIRNYVRLINNSLDY